MKKELRFRVFTDFVEKSTKGPGDLLDLTPEITKVLERSGMEEGSVSIFVIGSTAGITTIEFEPGLVKDLNDLYQKLIPRGLDYAHHATWGDRNGFSHLRASLQGPSVTVPFTKGELQLGTWQQVVLAEFDDRPRKRRVVVQCLGQ